MNTAYTAKKQKRYCQGFGDFIVCTLVWHVPSACPPFASAKEEPEGSRHLWAGFAIRGLIIPSHTAFASQRTVCCKSLQDESRY